MLAHRPQATHSQSNSEFSPPNHKLIQNFEVWGLGKNTISCNSIFGLKAWIFLDDYVDKQCQKVGLGADGGCLEASGMRLSTAEQNSHIA